MNFCYLPKEPGPFERLYKKEFAYVNSEKFSFLDKILTVADLLGIRDEEIHEKRNIATEIMNLLKPFYPECDVIIFGSSMNGFGFRGCDLDLLFLPFPEYCNSNFKGKGNGIVPSPYQVSVGNYPKHKLLCMEDVNHLKFVQHVLRRETDMFKSILFIPAKCPLLNIKFRRKPYTGDLTASNRLVMRNTELLWLFGVLDVRVRPLVLVLRYWAKSLGFISKSLLSSYAFTLLIAFFLQNTEPPVLPSVKTLIELSEMSQVIDGWQCSICLDVNLIPKSKNSASLNELLIQFFMFYWNFDFVQNVVSPYYGRPVPVKEFKNSKDERIRGFMISPFSIQDPFILSRNVSRNSDVKTCFKLSLSIAKELIMEEKCNFPSLFQFSFYQSKIVAMTRNTEEDFPLSQFICFPLYLDYEIYAGLGITSELNPWYKKACKVVIGVMQYGLLIECEVTDSIIWGEKDAEPPAKKKKVTHSSTDKKFQLVMSIQCELNLATLNSRKKVDEKEIKDDEDSAELPAVLKKEFNISKHLIKTGTSHKTLWFLCQCYKYTSEQIPDVLFVFSPLNDETVFHAEKNYLCSFIQRNTKIILKEDLNWSA